MLYFTSFNNSFKNH